MGVGVSGWQLARAVAVTGQLGMVSGTILDVVFARRLQAGDPGGHLRRAAEHFPAPEVAERVVERYFIDGGKPADKPYKQVPQHSAEPRRSLQELAIVANFCEVWLAKEGHDNSVGINYMEKLRVANLPAIYGAVLAEVDYVAIGAGIPREVPGILDSLAGGRAVTQRLDVDGAGPDDKFTISLDPADFFSGAVPEVPRPKFLAIIASTVLAMTLAKKSTGRIDGFVIEAPTAGGHNAPPRGELQLDDNGEPVYGSRDQINFKKIVALDIPFWLAGGYAHKERIEEARALGAAGVQLGTPFALTKESNLLPWLKQQIIQAVLDGGAEVFTSPTASPTGFPFKLACLKGTLSEPDIYAARPRICDLGYLRQAYKTGNGRVGWRCSAEPIDIYEKKGGSPEGVDGRICLCNGLMSNIGLPQLREGGYLEPPVVTLGDDVDCIKPLIPEDGGPYAAAAVVDRFSS